MKSIKSNAKRPETSNRIVGPSTMMANLSLEWKHSMMSSKTMQNVGDKKLNSNITLGSSFSDEDRLQRRSQSATTMIRELGKIEEYGQKLIGEDDNFKETYLIFVVHGIWCNKEYQQINKREFDATIKYLINRRINEVPYNIVTFFIDWKTLVDQSKQRKRMNSCQIK